MTNCCAAVPAPSASPLHGDLLRGAWRRIRNRPLSAILRLERWPAALLCLAVGAVSGRCGCSAGARTIMPTAPALLSMLVGTQLDRIGGRDRLHQQWGPTCNPAVRKIQKLWRSALRNRNRWSACNWPVVSRTLAPGSASSRVVFASLAALVTALTAGAALIRWHLPMTRCCGSRGAGPGLCAGDSAGARTRKLWAAERRADSDRIRCGYAGRPDRRCDLLCHRRIEAHPDRLAPGHRRRLSRRGHPGRAGEIHGVAWHCLRARRLRHHVSMHRYLRCVDRAHSVRSRNVYSASCRRSDFGEAALAWCGR